ncbi:hypothetical protein KM908_14540 [Alkalihalobacillus clausii]|uniref:phBC6A51 family helix-turn-helix protein n=1 Tax=Shouchella clausii TaxID=79880 RepID=UPI001C226A53|nr:phBC6A51 family helix-turn-helix protein [Shouchella clausii]MBU8597361.1 hypothetical protein [Shouchella clausii]MCY1105854.1 phBC6A51 family helix-turn-helix protein [Shouchella clausii]
MANRKLSEKQWAAIALLALPKKGGLTNLQIAERVGVAEKTIYEWKKSDSFTNALKEQIMRNTLDRLPEVMDSVPDHIINDGNAAMLRTLLQAHSMLTEKVDVSNTSDRASLDEMREQVAKLRGDKSGD